MDHQTLPHLTTLRDTLGNIATAVAGDAGLRTQCTIAGQLLDRMIIDATIVPKLKAAFYQQLSSLLPDIEATIADNGSSKIIGELGVICTTADGTAFEHCCKLCSNLQCMLLALETQAATAHCKAIMGLEANYNQQLAAAVANRPASVAGKTSLAAQNARDYDEQALLHFIRKAFPQETEIGIVESGFISGGYSKYTVGIKLSNARSLPETIILRGDGSTNFGGSSVVDEYHLIKTLHEHGVSVPKPLALEESGQVFGSPFMLVERKLGSSIGHMFNLPEPNPAICSDIAARLAEVHRVPLAAIGDHVRGAHSRSSDQALASIEDSLQSWRALNISSPLFETAFDWLRRNAHLNDQTPRALVHADYGLNNLLIDQNRVSAILDWEFAHVGNPAYDLGYFYFQAARLSSWDDFLSAYKQAGMDIPDAAPLNYNIVLSATRLGVMLSQVAATFTSGTVTSLGGAAIIGGCYYEGPVIKNIAHALERVL